MRVSVWRRWQEEFFSSSPSPITLFLLAPCWQPLLGSAEQVPWATMDLLFCCTVLPGNLQHWCKWGLCSPQNCRARTRAKGFAMGRISHLNKQNLLLQSGNVLQGVLGFVYSYCSFCTFISFPVLMELPCIFVFLIFSARRACYSSCSAAISYGRLCFHSFIATSALFSSEPCASPYLLLSSEQAAITIDKPQVCVHKLRPIFLYSLFFSAVLHELSVLEVFSSGLCFTVWAQQVSFTWALGWLCWVGALGSKAQWFPVWNSVGCDVAGAADLTAPSPRIHPPAMKMCK